MLVDTHAHLYLEQFEDDLEEVITRARDAGVEQIVLPAVDVSSIHAALDLCNRFPGLHAMAALHPSETEEASEEDFNAVVELCQDERVVAIGESGLDYYWDDSFADRQKHFFRRHIRLAIRTELPLVIHNRDAGDDIVRILREERDRSNHPERLRGIFHCYTGPERIGYEALEMGFLMGIGGILTFSNSNLSDQLGHIGLEHMVVETDAPYLAPEPHRGDRNEPAYVRDVAQRLAEVKGVSLEHLAEKTTANARELFDLPD